MYCRMNILLDKHEVGKLADFGFSIQLPKTHANKTMITAICGLPGTHGYRPPEYITPSFRCSVTSTVSEWYDEWNSKRVFIYCHFSGHFRVLYWQTCVFWWYEFGMAFKDDAAEFLYPLQTDCTEDERCDVDAFHRMADTKAGDVSQTLSSELLILINATTKRIPSKRPQISAVSLIKYRQVN